MVNNSAMKSTSHTNPEALWSHLHWLVVLGEQGSYTGAAARLGVSKAAMSQHIAELERAAGVPLVRRTTRSVGLTEAGRQLVDDTRGAFERIAESFAGVRDRAGVPHGRLRVTAPVALARQQLVPRLPAFLRAYPEVRLELDLSDKLRSLTLEGLDLAIRHTAVAPDTHVAWLLCTTQSVLVANRAYLRRTGMPQTPDDLRQHDCLHYPRTQEAPAWTFEPVVPGNSPRMTVPVTGPLAANNSEALRDAALAGLGIALVPDFSAQAALQAGKLVAVLPDWRPVGTFSETIHAIRPYSAHVPRAVAVFVEWLREAFAPGFRA
ncbi:LysR family transcriptional regulator [Acidovorax carolinensis]|uniref:LysR family transcriptional regulator n=2 Tax=Acidovorax carolinensis TaxID=553814 RepID=A0A240UF20_9BURK|nr:LysR family transcriptional regulator [Acidovorax carolinensis]ART59639.1 LysR family transcriptional regulator [Acidovorax carolinensis]